MKRFLENRKGPAQFFPDRLQGERLGAERSLRLRPKRAPRAHRPPLTLCSPHRLFQSVSRPVPGLPRAVNIPYPVGLLNFLESGPVPDTGLWRQAEGFLLGLG
jgi:hypothetical protein